MALCPSRKLDCRRSAQPGCSRSCTHPQLLFEQPHGLPSGLRDRWNRVQILGCRGCRHARAVASNSGTCRRGHGRHRFVRPSALASPQFAIIRGRRAGRRSTQNPGIDGVRLPRYNLGRPGDGSCELILSKHPPSVALWQVHFLSDRMSNSSALTSEVVPRGRLLPLSVMWLDP